jgi:Glycosyl transferase family 2
VSESKICVSIIVATKDRYDTLFDCVSSLLANYADPAVEIIVRDNSASPRIDAFAAAFGANPNLRYIADPRPVSQSENYELAVAAARGDYVTMIGDDDSISWGLLELARWMDRQDVDAFFPGFSVYIWPGVSGRLAGTNATGSWSWSNEALTMRVVDAASEREAVLAEGCTSLESLPRLYYGLVRKRCLDEVRERAGLVFPGPSPDMANAFTLSYCVRRFVTSSLPIFIAGNSRKSNAGLGLRGRHVGEIQDLPFLPADTAARWNACIPFFWSGQTIWSQSAYTAASAMGRADDYERSNNFRGLYARLLVFQPGYLDRTLKTMYCRHADHRWRLALEAIPTLGVVVWLWVTRISGFLLRRVKALSRPAGSQVQGLPRVSAAAAEVDARLRAMDFARWLDRQQPLFPEAKS